MKMRRVLTVGLVGGLLFGSVATADAAKKKKKKAPVKTVATSLYLHSDYPVGEAEAPTNLAEGAVAVMDKNKPTNPAPRSRSVFGVGNDQCSGNGAVFPTWMGNLQGTIKGDAKLTLHFASAPATFTARIWTDTPEGSCNDAYIPPAKEVSVTVPAGQSKVVVVFPKLNLKAQANVMIELLTASPAAQGRVLYDSPSAESVLQFQCAPASGKSCTS